eukprot:scaffold4733_cov170-Alexandrium_tamarense.AAC.40
MPSLLRQRPVFPVLILLLQSSAIVSFTSLDQQHQPRPTAYTYTERCSSVSSVVLFANPSGSDDGNKKSGYRFGDITKSLIGKRVEKVRASFCVNASQSTHVNTTITFTFPCTIVPSNHSQITGKPYEFGDLSRKIDESIKDKVNDLTGNDDYAFGDLSKWVDTQIKGEVNKFTKKESYQFGDMSREIVRRVASGQYTLDDLFLLLKALAIFEASISPVGDLANDVAGRVASALAMELDKRLKKSLIGDENYKLGDATKRTIANAVKSYTGNDQYAFGDVTRKVVASLSEDTKLSKTERPMLGMSSSNEMEPSIIEALDKWDSLSEKQLEEGLAKLELYVDLVEREGKK